MDSIQPPTKPPRGVKNVKETCGLLMTVIRTLSKSDSNEQRDQIRLKIEKEYKESNQGLQELVSINHNDLTKVMNLFGRLSTLISREREKIHTLKENLVACKKLLTCRREELKKIYLENIEYKFTLQYLEDIEQMKDVPSQLVNCYTKKDYLSATKLLVSSINTGETALKDIAGLHELKSELNLKKQELFTKLVAEIREQIYVNSTHEIVSLIRQGSARDSVDQLSALNTSCSERRTPVKRSQFRSVKSLEVPSVLKHSKISKNNAVEYADDTEYVVSNLVECIILLDSVPEFLEELKQSTQRDLKDLTVRTAKDLSTADSPNILLEYLQIVTEQFKKLLDMHKFILEMFKMRYGSNMVFDLREIWLKMQSVLQQMLSEYLDVDNVKKIEQSTPENSTLVSGEPYGISSFFTRKKYQRSVKGSLFRFTNAAQTDASHSASKLSMRERCKDTQLLCKPSPSYITQIFVPLSKFNEDIEQMVNDGSTDQTSKLLVFLNEFVGKMFVGKRYEEVVGNVALGDKEITLSTTPHRKELNGTVPNTPSPSLTVSKSKRKMRLLFLR